MKLSRDDDDATVGRILSRREIIHLFGAAGLTLLTGCGSSKGSSSSSGTGSSSTSTTTTSSNNTGTSSTSSTSSSSNTGTSSSSNTGTSSTGSLNVIATPAVTEGPFFVDEKLLRSDVVSGTTRVSVANGLPLALQLGVYSLASGSPVAVTGAYVDIWHADAIGTYSDEDNTSIQSEDTLGQNWLRGYQISDANGLVQFGTIYPGWYQGRAVHIHFKVRTYSGSSVVSEFTSQLFFDDTLSDSVFVHSPYSGRGTRSVLNANDSVYSALGTDGLAVGTHLMLAPASASPGYTATFNIGLT